MPNRKLDGNDYLEPTDPKVLERLELERQVRATEEYIRVWNMATFAYFKRKEELKGQKPFVPYFKIREGK